MDTKNPHSRLNRAEQSLRRHAWMLLLAAIGVLTAGAVIGIIRAPRLTLAYVHTLSWPAATLLLLVIFRRPIGSLLDRIEGGNLPTPFGVARIESPTGGGRHPGEDPDPDGRPTTPASSHTAEEPPLVESEDVAADETIDQLRSKIAEWEAWADDIQEQVLLHFRLNQVFEAQLALLRVLSAAPSGLNAQAVAEWFNEYKTTVPAWAPFELNALTNYLTANNLVFINPDGRWAISDVGRKLVELSTSIMYAQKTY